MSVVTSCCTWAQRHHFNSQVSNGNYLLLEYLQMLLQDDGTGLLCLGFPGEGHNEIY